MSSGGAQGRPAAPETGTDRKLTLSMMEIGAVKVTYRLDLASLASLVVFEGAPRGRIGAKGYPPICRWT